MNAPDGIDEFEFFARKGLTVPRAAHSAQGVQQYVLGARFAALLCQQSQCFCGNLRCLVTAVGVALARRGILRVDENKRISSAQCLALRASERGERLVYEHDRR